jgi:Fur family ferric uptake transcriptional regulator
MGTYARRAHRYAPYCRRRKSQKMKSYSTENRRRLVDYIETHPTASYTVEELSHALLSDGHGKSSLYRLVGQLCREGVLVKQSPPDGGPVRYRAHTAECTHHLHLQCTGCGRLIHLDRDLSDRLGSQLSSGADFILDEERTVLLGRCRLCKGASHA